MDFPDYAKLNWMYQQHHERFKKFISVHGLLCQECRGRGGYVIPVLDDGMGPFEPCGWCESTGYVTPHTKGLWLQWKRTEKHYRKD